MQASKEWSGALQELEQRRRFAQAMGGEDALARLRATGKLNARERINALVDPDSFEEFGALAGKGRYNADGDLETLTPSTQVMGVARVNNRKTVVVSDDFSIRGGSFEAAVAEKWIYADRYAYEYKLPLIRMVDTAGGSVKLLKQMGHTKIPGYALLPGVALLGCVPVVGIAMGACAGLGAIRATTAHFSIMPPAAE